MAKRKYPKAVEYAGRSLWEGFKTKDTRRKLVELFNLTPAQANDVIRSARKETQIYFPKR